MTRIVNQRLETKDSIYKENHEDKPEEEEDGSVLDFSFLQFHFTTIDINLFLINTLTEAL